MIPRESSGNLHDMDDMEYGSDTEPEIGRFSEEPETSASEFTSFAKPQGKQQISKRLTKNDYNSSLSKKQKQNSYDLQALEIEKRK